MTCSTVFLFSSFFFGWVWAALLAPFYLLTRHYYGFGSSIHIWSGLVAKMVIDRATLANAWLRMLAC